MELQSGLVREYVMGLFIPFLRCLIENKVGNFTVSHSIELANDKSAERKLK